MVNASGHIEQQLSKLQTQTADLATDIETLVDQYLQVLSEASKRQLVLAAYHVCTQIYPENFLELSLSQRNRLQQKLRALGTRIQEQLHDKWETAKRLSLQPAEEDGLAVIRQLFLEATAARDQPESETSTDQDLIEGDDNQAAANGADIAPETLEEPKRSQEKLLDDIRTLIGSEPMEVKQTEQKVTGPMQPAQLMRRQILIEKAIRDILKSVSENANQILQKADVMPEVPHALLTAAGESERLGHIPMKTPNLVRLAIKILHESPKSSSESSSEKNDDQPELEEDTKRDNWPDEELAAAIITDTASSSDAEADDAGDQVEEESISMPRFLQLESLPDFVMIHLRLSEIEFAETNVAVWRSRIRKKMAQLKRVGHAYKDAERQLAIAQAEDAWRASWTND